MKKLEVRQEGQKVCCAFDGKEITLAKAVKVIKENGLSSTPYTVKKWSKGLMQPAEFSAKPRSEKVYGTFAEAYQAATGKATAPNWEVRVEGEKGYYYNSSKRDWGTGKSFEKLELLLQ